MEVYGLLARLRSTPAFRFGKFSPIGVHESVFCFVRHAHRYDSYLVAINFGPLEATVDFVTPAPDIVVKVGVVVATTFNMKTPTEFTRGTEIHLDNVYLRPTEGMVVKMATA